MMLVDRWREQLPVFILHESILVWTTSDNFKVVITHSCSVFLKRAIKMIALISWLVENFEDCRVSSNCSVTHRTDPQDWLKPKSYGRKTTPVHRKPKSNSLFSMSISPKARSMNLEWRPHVFNDFSHMLHRFQRPSYSVAWQTQVYPIAHRRHWFRSPSKVSAVAISLIYRTVGIIDQWYGYFISQCRYGMFFFL